MRRIQEEFLKNWHINNHLRKPLVIRGARQVGKTTLVRQFCQNQGLRLLEVNLEKYPELDSVFASHNVAKILLALEDVLNTRMSDATPSLLLLDEIQATPAALACLRYFYEERPDLPVIATGSLLEFVLNDHAYSMPVGRIDFLHMGPMNFQEFLWAKNEMHFLERLNQAQTPADISSNTHERGKELVREFLFVGGMPEAILRFIRKGADAVGPVHAGLIQTYQADFVKYAKKRSLPTLQKVFRYCMINPCQKIKYTNISRDDLARNLKESIEMLRLARVIHPVYHASCSGVPLEATSNETVYKLLALDVGLVNYLQGGTWKMIRNMQESDFLTKGILLEQFVGQHLLHRGQPYQEPKLYYWIREGKAHNAEVDYIVEAEGDTAPSLVAVEVKAGAAGKIRSLHQWMLDAPYGNKKAARFNFSAGAIEPVSHQIGERQVKYELTTLPLYWVQKWCLRQ